jgi:uncharacterized RDD family membrane protein YckC
MTIAARGPAAVVVTSSAVDVVIEEGAPARYVGLVTRALAFAIDAIVINALAIAVTAMVALFYSIISVPDDLRTVAIAVGGVLYLLWVVGYFVTFWSTTGQTPGNRVLCIRVVPVTGAKVLPRRAVVRFAGLTLAALPLFAGFLLILVDDRRRGLQDRLGRTLVVEAPREEPEALRRRPGGGPTRRDGGIRG